MAIGALLAPLNAMQVYKAPATGGARTTAPAADRYQASANVTKEVSYKEMVALNAQVSAKELPVQSAVFRGALARHDYKAMEKAMQEMKPNDRLRTLEDLRKSQPNNYGQLLADVRSGKVKSEEVTLPVGIDRVKGSKWAQSGDGLDAALQLERQYAQGKVKLGNVPNDQLGFTDREANIVLNPKIASSPEGMAATLAHEGQHSFRTWAGTLKNDLLEETDAHMAQSAVWNEFGQDKYKSKAVDANNSWDSDAKYYKAGDDTAMMNHVAKEYTQGYRAMGDLAKAEDILIYYKNENKARKGNLVKEASDAELTGLFTTAKAFDGAVTEDKRDNFRKVAKPVVDELTKRGFIAEF